MPPISKTLSNLPIFSNYLKNVYIPVLEFESGVKLRFLYDQVLCEFCHNKRY